MFLQAKWIVLLHHWSLASLSVLFLVKYMTALLTNLWLVSQKNQCLHLTLKKLTKNLDQTVGIALYFLKYWQELLIFPSYALCFVKLSCSTALFNDTFLCRIYLLYGKTKPEKPMTHSNTTNEPSFF